MKLKLPLDKGPSRRTLKGRKDRHEAAVKKLVRETCVDRDGSCRLRLALWIDGEMFGLSRCDGDSQWAHMGEKRRARTRNQAPEIRHTTAGSLMLCAHHHDAYDRLHTLTIEPLTDRGADGPMRFTSGLAEFSE